MANTTPCGSCDGYGYRGHTNPEIGTRCDDCNGAGTVPAQRVTCVTTAVMVRRDPNSRRMWQVLAVNEKGEQFCMERTLDQTWADTYAEHVRYYFGPGVSRVFRSTETGPVGPDVSAP
jgi:hypothetical protein